MAWLLLVVAGVLEVLWAMGLKKYGFAWSWGSAITIVGVIVSFVLLSLAMRTLPLGTAYAIWTGIGAVGAAIAGMVLFGESKDVGRVVCIALIVLGIAGLKVLTPDAKPGDEPAPLAAETTPSGR